VLSPGRLSFIERAAIAIGRRAHVSFCGLAIVILAHSPV
jgi:hypothetical protein